MGNLLQRHGYVQANDANVIQDQVIEQSCQICTEPISPDKVFNNNNRCMHPFCSDCIARYIEIEVEDNIGNIPCPSFDCMQWLDPIFCRSLISKRSFDKWCDALCTLAVSKVQNRCYCPYEGCSALILNECNTMSVKKTQCPNCKHYFCFECQIPWHAGYSCEQRLGHENDCRFAQLVESERWRRCYNCGHCVET